MTKLLVYWLPRLALICAAIATADLLDGLDRAALLGLIVALAVDAGRFSVKHGQA